MVFYTFFGAVIHAFCVGVTYREYIDFWKIALFLHIKDLSSRQEFASVKKICYSLCIPISIPMARNLLRPAQKLEFSLLLQRKQEVKEGIFATYSKKEIPLYTLISIKSDELRDELTEAFDILGYKYRVYTPKEITKNDLYGFDIFVSDDHTGLNLREVFRHGVVSILPMEHEYSALMSDFRPLAFEGNTFRVRKIHLYHYLERIALARENLSYP